jgi:hypothetical protein
MIRLNEAQAKELDGQEQPTIVVDPRTGQEYLLIRREVYDKVKAVLKPFGRAWDNAEDDDLIRKDI